MGDSVRRLFIAYLSFWYICVFCKHFLDLKIISYLKIRYRTLRYVRNVRNWNMIKNTRLLNLISGLTCQVLSSISGLVLPNLVLNTYGSVLNGLVSIVTQMLAYLSLVEMGLTSAALVSLYKPMATGNYQEASGIFVAVNKFYQRVAALFSAGSIACGIVAQFVINDDIPTMTIWLVVLSLAGNNIVSYLLLNKYKVLMQADDRLYVINFVHIFGILIQFFLSYCAIKATINIAGVKSSIIVADLLETIILWVYCKKNLPEISLKAKAADNAIKQRKDIITHQVLSLVLNNTDVILLTFFSPSLSIVSVYSIYAMIGTSIQNVVNTIIGMFSSKMGQLYAINDHEGVKAILRKYEGIYGVALFTVYSCMDILIMPFISLYTREITDERYYYPIVGLLFSIFGITRMFRLPYTELTNVAGRFKETKVQAKLEAGLNLVFSLILLPQYGIAGVLIGSIVGEVYRTIHSYIYCNTKVLNFDWHRSVFLGLTNGSLFAIIHFVLTSVRQMKMGSFVDFFSYCIVCGLFIFTVYAVSNYLAVIGYSKMNRKGAINI